MVKIGKRGDQIKQKFDIYRVQNFMPSFDEKAADVFFEVFEKVARESDWPDEKWPLLVQSVLTGKAQRAVALRYLCGS